MNRAVAQGTQLRLALSWIEDNLGNRKKEIHIKFPNLNGTRINIYLGRDHKGKPEAQEKDVFRGNCNSIITAGVLITAGSTRSTITNVVMYKQCMVLKVLHPVALGSSCSFYLQS